MPKKLLRFWVDQDHRTVDGGGQAAETSKRFQRFSRIFQLGGESLKTLGRSSIHEQHFDQRVVEKTFRISASAVGAAHGADPTVCDLGQRTK
jgi:hypothetical protein